MPVVILETTAVTGAALLCMLLLTRRRVARWPLYLPMAVVLCGASAWLAAALLTTQAAIPDSAALCVVLILLGLLPFRGIDWPTRLFLGALVLTSVAYLAAIVGVTIFGSLPLLGVGLSLTLLVLEVVGLALSVAFGYEMAEVLGRQWRDPETPAVSRWPRVCVQVPAYNEPPELVDQTLRALAQLDYKNYVVQVVVNNTTDPALWRPVQQACQQLGKRFRFVNLPKCEGFKAGALNRATELLGQDIDLVAIVDADYIVQPDFLKDCVPHFEDPEVAFVQTPQHYREWKDSPYLRGLFYAYRYFFDVSMVARARTNAIIFGGTMGLIRLSVLRQTGGWAEWCITEDAEASLRILADGWRGVYLSRSYGQGLMPLDFDGLRRQRFRWAFGGVQILRRHLGLILGLRPSKLTLAQRYHYLFGGLGWFGDLVSSGLGAFLLVTAPLLVLGHPLFLRQLSGLLLALPLFLLVAGLLRLGWALKLATGAAWRDVLPAMVIMLALGWTVSQACVRGLILENGVFLRTPKVKMPSRVARAVRSTLVESAVAGAFACLMVALAVFGMRPLATFMAVLVGWQALAFASAPIAALMSQEVQLTPLRRLLLRSSQSTGERPWVRQARVWVPVVTAAVVLAVLLLPAAVVAPMDEHHFEQGMGLSPAAPLPVFGAGSGRSKPTASGSTVTTGGGGSPTSTSGGGPTQTASPTPYVSPVPSPTPSPLSSPSPSPSVSPAPSPTPPARSPQPSPQPTSYPSPTAYP